MSDSIFFKVFASSAAGADRAALVNASHAEWDHAVSEAVLHQCVPLFRQRLRESDLLQCLSESAQEQLTQLTRYTAMTNLQGLHQLHELMTRLDASTPLIALKGACLARVAYQDISLRQMRDLDVMAQPQAMARVGQTLRQLGYEQDRRFEETWAHLHQEPTFTKSGAMAIELHRSLLDKSTVFDIDYDGIWSRAIPSPDTPGLLYMAPEDQLIHVCLHAGYSNELNVGVYAFVDIATMAGMPRLDWALVVKRARQWKAERCVFLTLRMAEILVQAVIPADVMNDLKPSDFSDDVLQHGLDAVRHKLADGYVSTSMFAQLAVTLFDYERLQKLPGKIKRRFLLKPEERQTWKGSPHASATWYGQLEPLFKGMTELMSSREKRGQLRARIQGVRLRRWMEPAQ